MNGWWQRRTLRFRLASWYALGGTLLLAAFSATLYFYVADRMARPLGHFLRFDLAEVQRRLDIRKNGDLWWDGRPIANQTPSLTQYPWFELWNENDELVRRFWPFDASRVREVPLPPPRDRETISVFSVAPDLRLRVLSLPFPRDEGKSWTLRVLRIHQPATDALGALRWIIFLALPTVIALLVASGYWVTRRWLVPLDRMAIEADQITAHDLSRRLPVDNPHDEIGRLATIFNVTLDRLESSFVALDRFVADASHELRTPLTTLRSVGEVGLRRSRSVEEYREIIGSMLEEAQRLQLLIQRLLDLATTEGGARLAQRSEIRLDEYVAACAAELSILAEQRGQRFEVQAAPCRVWTDPVFFRQALQNLIDNAVKYSPDNSVIRITVSENGTQVEVTVSDEGPGIRPEDQAQLTRRFFRPDRGRGRSSGGFGLGLSLTKAYMRVLDGALDYVALQPHGSLFRLTLPKA